MLWFIQLMIVVFITVLYINISKELLGINNPIYLATFIIPKGSIYFVNPLGVIVSSRIKYTGKYIKL